MALPAGTVTMLFSDIESSTRLLKRSATAIRRYSPITIQIAPEVIDGHGDLERRARRLLLGNGAVVPPLSGPVATEMDEKR